ncbi:MAG: 4-hydroxy-3-methylbut-2-enyl diphosphate reductase [Candidatus Kryptonium sp.]|nr:4-hydroxy-3-methylbut-2-enyl diphosphate reductase [Candidatus Kryptonium sp.]MCX7762692.1 4-hydroxy-3-methylbut-2-enyl diphosphate reductase [Candidatus Kryptonium sp.]MDW8108177.1 4-hydroxy-3-methylbut-2-enyl diphosphate reductase [Candidatus Kryptonium sp.]
MQVIIDKNAGFCWGVVRAIEIAEKELNASGKLYSLGEIIHNPVEVERLKQKGLIPINHDELANVKDAKVLIRAHGEPPSTYEMAQKYGIEIVDATCPVVTKLQTRIRKFYLEGYRIVIFGKKEHPEVIGLVGQCNGDAIVIKSLEEIEKIPLKGKVVLFSQTTMSKDLFYKIKEEIEKRVEELIVVKPEDEAVEFVAKDTICRQVSNRDDKLKEFARSVDVVIFVAGKNSSNGKVLFEICKSENPRTYFIEMPKELNLEWFKDCEVVGVTGATSTPQWLMEEVKKEIERLCNGQNMSFQKPS